MKYKIFIPFLLVSFFFLACSSTKENGCPEEMEYGNLGELNTSFDEISFPNINTQIRKINKKFVMESENPDLASFFNQNPQYIGFSSSEKDGIKKYYFAILTKFEDKLSSNIVYLTEDESLDGPFPLPSEINTPGFESYPAISSNDNILIFSSDSEGGFGETDLLVSFNEDGKWSEARNMGSIINSPGYEICPFIDPISNDLYFSSNGHDDSEKYDIYYSKYFGNGEWEKAIRMAEPINSSFSDKYPLLYDGRLYISSNRPGGCGGYDYYAFTRCAPIIFEGQIQKGESSFPSDGIIIVDDGYNQIQTDVEEDGSFSIVSDFEKKMIGNIEIRYENPCIKRYEPVINLQTECSDREIKKYYVEFILPDEKREFTFEEYNVPFFVSGYYLPNTSKNLEDLRMKFAYNLYGNSDSTKYIENPGKEYDSYSKVVDEALEGAIEFIKTQLSILDSECQSEELTLKIEVTGFSDDRKISDKAKYNGPDINSIEWGVNIKRGEQMDNKLLSILRAYYTAKYFEKNIFKNANYILKSNNVKWVIEGKGVDSSPNKAFERKRRVSVAISIDK